MSIGIGKTVIAKQSFQTEPELSDIAALTPTDGLFIVGNGTDFVGESGATVRTSLGLGSVATYDIDDIPGVGATAKTYYLNATDASDIGTYVIAQTTPSTNAQSNIVQANTGTAYTLIASFATPVGEPNIVSLPAGIATRTIWATVGASNETAMLKIELYKRTAGGVETLLRTSTSAEFSYTTISPVIWTTVFASASALNLTDRLVFKLYTARVSGPSTVTTTVYFEDGVTPSYIGTTITESNAALTALALPGTPSAADKFLYSSATGTWAYGDATAAGRALLDDASAAAQATTLGLGTGDSPIWTGATLQANAATATATLQASNAAATGPDVILRHTRGTIGSETATQSGDVLGRMLFGGFDDALTDSAMIRAVATETWSATAAGSKLEFYTVDNASLVQDLRLTIDQNGNVTTAGNVYGPGGDASACTYGFSGDTNTGLFSEGADILNLTAGGATRLQLTTGCFNLIMAGSAGNPSLVWANDNDTGFWHPASDELAVTLGGAEQFRWSGTATVLFGAVGDLHLRRISAGVGGSAHEWRFNGGLGLAQTQAATSLGIYASGVTWQAATVGASGYFQFNRNAADTATAGSQFMRLVDTATITAGVTDGYAGTLQLDPEYSAATVQTVTRHNYIDINNVAVSGVGPAAVTDACLFRFDAAAGTHKVVDGAASGWAAWIKYNVNGTLYYSPAHTSKMVPVLATSVDNELLRFDGTTGLVQSAGSGIVVNDAGQLALPTTGDTGGLLIGGDVALYRAGADLLSTGWGDTFQAGYLSAVGATAATDTVYTGLVGTGYSGTTWGGTGANRVSACVKDANQLRIAAPNGNAGQLNPIILFDVANNISYLGEVTDTTPAEGRIYGEGASGTNVAGGDAIFAAGKGTGTGAASCILAAWTTLGTGSTLQSTRLTGVEVESGTTAKLGFYGVSPTVRQVLATGAGATVDQVITALQTLGLVAQS